MLSRRKFLKLSGAALTGLALASQLKAPATQADSRWPEGPEVLLGRVAWPWGVPVLTRPRPEGARVRTVMPDDFVVIRREIVGLGMMPHNHVWYELDDGFIYSSYVYPARNHPQTPLTSVPPEGVWAELSVPYIDARKQPSPDASVIYRFYYGGVYKVSEVLPPVEARSEVWYRVGTEIQPNMYAPAQAFRIVAPDEVTPISPNVSDKRIVVGLTTQTLTAYEGRAEVFRARIASGAQFFGKDGKTLQGGTGLGTQYLWSKRISRQMQGGTLESGWDLPGVGWVGYFAANGEALHAAYWHNDFGRPKSRGCINMKPEDAKWLFRWTLPHVAYQPGDVIVDWEHRGTPVDIQAEA